ncbi:MAG: hypothetical protein U0W24_10170 [Bacteroidales bacterium]
MMKLSINILVFTCLFSGFYSCETEFSHPDYKTRNIVIVVVDGARYSETWADSGTANIVYMRDELSKLGCICTNFYNNGPTYTLAGHVALTTGVYQEINNSGQEIPFFPSVFQYFDYKNKQDSMVSYIISSKGKLQVLSNCQDAEWTQRFMPKTACGMNNEGVQSVSREDSLTFIEVIRILNTCHSKLTLLSFREPDYSAHQGNWNNYLKGISDTDKLIFRLWNFLQNDSVYKETTTLFVTNDHGRHLDTIADGFISHGDGCEGCRHLFFFAAGPDFKNNEILKNRHELIDIPATVAELLQIDLPHSNGTIMYDLFK